MSGGFWDYKDNSLKFEIFNYKTETTEQAMEENPLKDKIISGIVFDALNLLHEFDWYISGDTSEEDYRIAVKAFKDRWLSDANKRSQYAVDVAIAVLKSDLQLLQECL